MNIQCARRSMMRPAMVLIAATSALALTACGSSSTTSASSSSAKRAVASSSAPKAVPGAFGEIAAISGQTIQVQSKQAQVGVTFTSATKIHTTASAAISEVAVGDCVQARPAQPTAGGLTGSTPNSPGAVAPTTVDAVTVSISQPVNGGCGGYGGYGGYGAGGKGANAKKSAAAAPSGAPGGAGRGARAFGAAGSVTSVNAGVIDMQSKVGGKTANITVNTSSATTYSKVVATDSSALVVGQCAAAVGPMDSTGSITAKSITLSPPVNGDCTRGGGQR